MPPIQVRLAVRSLRAMVSGLSRLGHDAPPLLALADIDAGLLDDPDARIPIERVVAFIRAAVERTGDDNLGLHMAECAELGSFDAPFYAMHASATLGAAYERLSRYQRLFHDTSRIELKIGDAHATLRHRLPGGQLPARHGAEFLLASWVRAGRAVTGVDWSPSEVRFAHPRPANAGDHERFFDAPIRFSTGENSFSLEANLLALPSTRADATLASLLDRYAADRIALAPAGERLADRVRSLLAAELRSGEIGASSLAKRLGMSVRSLSRLLSAEGTTYQSVLDGLRHELAARRLSESPNSVWEVAFDLGFSDLSSFYRAFRRWTGMTPAEFRGRSRAARA